jgi:hypothetical protein
MEIEVSNPHREMGAVFIRCSEIQFPPCRPAMEQTFYGEFDGRRKKRVLIKIIGEYSYYDAS